jgi:hypothetical protein
LLDRSALPPRHWLLSFSSFCSCALPNQLLKSSRKPNFQPAEPPCSTRLQDILACHGARDGEISLFGNRADVLDLKTDRLGEPALHRHDVRDFVVY